MAQSLFEQLGGEPKLRAIIDDFVERVFADPMIGFFFSKTTKERIKAKEYEFAAGHLGAPVQYTGRPLPHAHSAHPITGGHFMRRLQILKETLQAHGAPDAVREHWLEHSERMRPFITQQAGSACDDDMTAKTPLSPPVVTPAEPPALQPAAQTTAAATQAKPMPSVDEINAYLERSAALTKKRLPLAFNAPENEQGKPETAPTGTAPAASSASTGAAANVNTARALPLVKGPKP